MLSQSIVHVVLSSSLLSNNALEYVPLFICDQNSWHKMDCRPIGCPVQAGWLSGLLTLQERVAFIQAPNIAMVLIIVVNKIYNSKYASVTTS